MKKFTCLMMLFSFFLLESKSKKEKKAVCCPGVSWTSKEECKSDEGNYIMNDKCCEQTFLGKKDDPDQVCCGACTEDIIEPGVD